MAKAGELDWSDLKEKTDKQELKKSAESFNWLDYRHTRTEEELQKKAPAPILKKGEVPERQTNAEIAEYILRGTQNQQFRQATDEEMFGHLVVSEDKIEKAEQDWNGKLNGFYEAAKKPLGPPVNAFGIDEEWKPGGSFLDNLSKSEKEAYLNRQKQMDKEQR